MPDAKVFDMPMELGLDAGAQNWAMLTSLIETCKLNQIKPHSYFTGVLTAIVNGHKQKDINGLLAGTSKPEATLTDQLK